MFNCNKSNLSLILKLVPIFAKFYNFHEPEYQEGYVIKKRIYFTVHYPVLNTNQYMQVLQRS